MPCCCAINCHLTKGVRFFVLPRKDPQRCDQWIKNINREDLTHNAVVCEVCNNIPIYIIKIHNISKIYNFNIYFF